MNSQTESRGWEIEDNYNEHFLDDPLIDLTEDFSEGNSGNFYVALSLLVILSVGLFFMQAWTRPPVLVFPNISLPAASIIDQPGWKISCTYFNPATKVLRPNYGNPLCTEAAARKRGEL